MKDSKKSYLVYSVIIVLLLLAAVLVVLKHNSDTANKTASQSVSSTQLTTTVPSRVVPSRVLVTLNLIDQGKWPAAAAAPGTRGGDPWYNLEKKLPVYDKNGKKLHYQEWDINPKKKRRHRDAERIITSDQGDAWYTLDHYRTYKRIR